MTSASTLARALKHEDKACRLLFGIDDVVLVRRGGVLVAALIMKSSDVFRFLGGQTTDGRGSGLEKWR